MFSKFHSSLLRDLSLMLHDANDHDVIIQVGENQNIKEFRAHSSILKARSLYFKSAFSSGWIIKKNNMIEFQKPNINPLVFEMILKHIYLGEVDLTKQSGTSILGLLVASDELLFEELFEYIQDYLIESSWSWIEQKFVYVLNVIFKIPNCKKLLDHCLRSICSNPQSVTTLKDFQSLDKDILFYLLKREDLQIEEIVMWDFLIKWGIEQTPGLGSENSDRSKWNNKNFEELKNTLNQFIPLIRFLEISSTDFFYKVRPYESVISHNIYEEVMKFYMKHTLPKTIISSPRAGKIQIESNLIKSKLACIIVNWIERKDVKNLSFKKKYKFELLYRGSRDGISVRELRSRCKDQGPSLVLVKQRQKIYGGYNPLIPLGFGQNRYRGWSNTTESFIFSFENGEDIRNMKIGRVNSNYTDRAINLSYKCGFNFGDAFYMCDDKRAYFHKSACYDDIIDSNIRIFPKEIEFFKISTS